MLHQRPPLVVIHAFQVQAEVVHQLLEDAAGSLTSGLHLKIYKE